MMKDSGCVAEFSAQRWYPEGVVGYHHTDIFGIQFLKF